MILLSIMKKELKIMQYKKRMFIKYLGFNSDDIKQLKGARKINIHCYTCIYQKKLVIKIPYLTFNTLAD